MSIFFTIATLTTFLLAGEGQALVSQQEFRDAVTSNEGFPAPSDDQYNNFIRGLAQGGITNRMEAAMFLAQALHESKGLTAKEEIRCVNGDPCTEYQTDWSNTGCVVNGKRYFGRGYFQLTYCPNYRAASQGLGMGEELRNNPELVAREDLAWNTAFWFWRTEVKPALKGTNQFGLTTRAINGREAHRECHGQNIEQSKRRFRFYETIFRLWRIEGQPDERGCY